MSNNPPVEIRFTARFESEVRRLSRRYRRIRQDIQMLIDRLQTGERPGDQIPNIDYLVFKVRIRNSDAQKGKSGAIASSTISKQRHKFYW